MIPVFARGLAAVLCVEGAFYCWSAKQRHSLSSQLPLYDDPDRAPSGIPFSAARRRTEVQRLLANEFGVEERGAVGSTPDRGKKWISGWFFDRPYSEIDRNMVKVFVAWAWFNVNHPSEMSAEKAAEVDADIDAIEAAVGQPFRRPSTDGVLRETPWGRRRQRVATRSQGLLCMRPNVDETAPFHAHHPLLIYVLTQFVLGTLRQRLVMRELGFERLTLYVERETPLPSCRSRTRRKWRKASQEVSFSYWHRPAQGTLLEQSNRNPIVICHGIGLGYGVAYPPLLRELVRRADASGGRPILCVELPHVSLTVPQDYGPSAADSVRATCAMLRRYGVDETAASAAEGLRADFMGHSCEPCQPSGRASLPRPLRFSCLRHVNSANARRARSCGHSPSIRPVGMPAAPSSPLHTFSAAPTTTSPNLNPPTAPPAIPILNPHGATPHPPL